MLIMQAVKTAFLAVLISTSSSVMAEGTSAAAENTAAPSAVATATAAPDTTSTNAGAAGIFMQAPALTNDPSLNVDVRIKAQGGPGQIRTSRAYITVGTNRFAFLVPGGFKIDTSDGQKVTLVRADCACVLSLRILEALPESGLSVDLCRQKVMQEHPACKIDEEFSLGAGGATGPAFEFRWKGDGGVRRTSRVAYVPLRAAVVEFSLDSSPENYGSMLTHLNYVMLTFRASDPGGNIEPTPLYNNI